jgi:hypothetical protein
MEENIPIIEIYEYKIFNCDEKKLNSYKLKPISNIPGKITAYGGNNDEELYSKDVIGEEENDFKYDKKFLKKFQFNDNIFNTIFYFYNLYSIFNVRKTSNFGKLWKNPVNLNYFKKMLKICIPKYDLPKHKSYILKKKITNEQVIVFGDIHGSFHTFFRQLLRLHKFGVLDISTFIINPNYIIIFLGDVIDRGLFSLEILLMILCLIKNNPNKIIYNRGNHEEFFTNLNGGLMNEIKIKVSEKKQKKLFESINKYYEKLSSAIYLELPDSSFFLSHGGFSKHELNNNTYKSLVESNDDIFLITDADFMDTIDITKTHGTLIRWSDFTYENNCAYRGYEKGINCINKDDVIRFLKKAKCDFIIRGHQDSGGNYILSDKETITPYYNFNGSILCINYNIFGNSVIYNDLTDENEEDYNAKKGCICRINVNEFNKNIYSINNVNLLPVLTTSTNTDINRPLCKDSFIVIKQCKNIKNFNDSFGANEDDLIDLPIFVFEIHSIDLKK